MASYHMAQFTRGCLELDANRRFWVAEVLKESNTQPTKVACMPHISKSNRTWRRSTIKTPDRRLFDAERTVRPCSCYDRVLDERKTGRIRNMVPDKTKGEKET